YARLRVIVIDDGSKDRTLEIVTEAFHDEVAAGRVVVLTKPNSGKAHALNFGLEHVTEEIFVGIDADTVISPGAVSKLVPHFVDARVAAVAGNAKVGNRVNLWTRWQALEYVTSQNFERRALNTLGAVSVVPGALGAWRTQLVGALSYAADRHFHPESADASSFEKLLLFFLTFLIIDFVTSAIAFALERRDADHREDIWLLGDIWLQRFTYRQLFSVVLFKTLK